MCRATLNEPMQGLNPDCRRHLYSHHSLHSDRDPMASRDMRVLTETMTP